MSTYSPSRALSWAHMWVQSSFEDLEKDSFVLSWSKAPIARLCFLIDAVEQAIRLLFTSLSLFPYSAYALYTWGKRLTPIREAAREMNEIFNRLLLSLIGALLSPSLAYAWRNRSLLHTAISWFSSCMPSRVSFSIWGFRFSTFFR